jgi:hypothetical protein
MQNATDARPRQCVIETDADEDDPRNHAQQRAGRDLNHQKPLNLAIDLVEHLERFLLSRQRLVDRVEKCSAKRVSGEQQEIDERHDDDELRRARQKTHGTDEDVVADSERRRFGRRIGRRR